MPMEDRGFVIRALVTKNAAYRRWKITNKVAGITATRPKKAARSSRRNACPVCNETMKPTRLS